MMLVSRGQPAPAGSKLATRPLPPPPVPPRPSKALVAEALARTRSDGLNGVAVPTRRAPPPPTPPVPKDRGVQIPPPKERIQPKPSCPVKNVSESHFGKQVTQGSEGQHKGDFQTRSSDECCNSAPGGQQGNPAIHGAEEVQKVNVEKTDIPATIQRLEPLLNPKEQEESPPVSHAAVTKPQSQETVSFPQRNEEKIESNRRNIQEAQNYHYSRSQHTIVFNGTDEYVRTTYSSSQEQEATIVKQNRTIEDKQQKIRRHAPHMLPTGQHKHDNTYASTGTRNTVLVIDNNSTKREIQQQAPDNKDIIVNGIIASSCSPLVENLIVELRESSQQRTHSRTKEGENGVNSSGNNEFIESLYKKGSQPRIQHSDWFEVDNGKPVRYSSCHITLEDSSSFNCSELSVDVDSCRARHIGKRRNMASLQGLPPLPKSLSGINLFEGGTLQQKQEVSTPRGMTKSGSFRQLAAQSNNSATARPGPSSSSGRGPTPPTPGVLHHQHLRNGEAPPPPPPVAPRMRKPTGLDAQLAILRKEMFGLRQLDLSLLSQLWSLNESIQEFRQLLQEQEDNAALSPPSPSSADEGEEFYSPLRYRATIPLSAVPEQYRLSSSSSQSSIEYGDV